jgi:hypothetical protein
MKDEVEYYLNNEAYSVRGTWLIIIIRIFLAAIT